MLDICAALAYMSIRRVCTGVHIEASIPLVPKQRADNPKIALRSKQLFALEGEVSEAKAVASKHLEL